MTSQADTQWELPDLPTADDRQLRRAIRRGVLRTALVGAVYIVVGATLVGIVAGFILDGLGRQDQLHRYVTAWHVAHPEFSIQENGAGASWLGRYESFDARLTAEPTDPAAVRVRLATNVLGHLGYPAFVPQSPAYEALRQLGTTPSVMSKRAELRKLSSLPASTTASALVAFASPLGEDALQQWLSRQPMSVQGRVVGNATYLMTAGDQTTRVWNGGLQAPVYGWSLNDWHEAGDWTVLSSFRKWVSELHGSDADNLHMVGIDLARLRAAASAGLVHGVIVAGLPPAALVKLLRDPDVASVQAYRIAFTDIP